MTMNNLPVKAPPRKQLPQRYEESESFLEALSAFESETTDVLVRTSPKNERVILHVLILMLVGAIVLSAFVKLDRVVTGPGLITSVGGPLYVSPLNAGVVREVRVKVGDVVKKGQVLATLDSTINAATVAQMRQKLESDEAAIERLTAEHGNQTYTPSKPNPYNELQLSIWHQRHAEYQSNLANLDAQIANASAVIAQYQQDSQQYDKRMKLSTERQQMYEPLVQGGYVSPLQLNSLRDSTEEMTRLAAMSRNQIAAQKQTEAATRAQRAAYIEKWHADVGGALVATRNDRDSTKENLEIAQKTLEQSTLVSPSDAIVLRIGKVSTGAVAGATADISNPQLFTLVPMDAPLEAEVDVPGRDVGFIRPKDPVQIKLDAYSFTRHGIAKGIIKSISEGSFTTDENNSPVPPYFKVRVAITEIKLRKVPSDFRLVPGMTLVGDVMVGKRTILTYLMEGALRTGSEAMREVQ